MTNKKSNFRSKINRELIVKDYLELSKFLSKDKMAKGYNFSYYLDGRCSIGTFN